MADTTTLNKQSGLKKVGGFFAGLVRHQIFIPLMALLLLVIFNLIADPSFFAIALKPNSNGDMVLTGNLITILDNASELVILAIGMTLVTAASGAQRRRHHRDRGQRGAAGTVRHRIAPRHAASPHHRGVPRLLPRVHAVWRVQRRAGVCI